MLTGGRFHERIKYKFGFLRAYPSLTSTVGANLSALWGVYSKPRLKEEKKKKRWVVSRYYYFRVYR